MAVYCVRRSAFGVVEIERHLIQYVLPDHTEGSGVWTMSTYSFSLGADVARNVLYIEQRGLATAADFRDLKRAFLAEVGKLSPGFAIINDQRELEPYGDEAMDVAKELVEITNRHQAARVIRIVPADLLSTVQLSSTLVSGRSQYTSIRVGTPEEAEEALDALSDH